MCVCVSRESLFVHDSAIVVNVLSPFCPDKLGNTHTHTQSFNVDLKEAIFLISNSKNYCGPSSRCPPGLLFS